MLKLSDFDYCLDKKLIAQFPLIKRDNSSLLVFNKEEKKISHNKFYEIVDFLNAGDLLILNDAKVVPSRLSAKPKGRDCEIEILLLEQLGARCFRALIKPLKKIKFGEEMLVDGKGLFFKLIDLEKRIIEFSENDVQNKLEAIGHVPLPKYIKRKDCLADRQSYQTVYARSKGAVAAPTAGLHFTEELLEKIRDKGIHITFITLHVGYGTFASIRKEDISLHEMEKEYCHISKEAIALIREVKNKKGRVFSVGTTSTRALEANKDKVLDSSFKGEIKDSVGIFIYPPYEFSVVDALITNFHMPKSTPFILTAAFAGLDKLKGAYLEAQEKKYRLFSYGDAMLVL